MKRALAWLAASFGVHLGGLIAFWWTWNAAFGLDGRTIAPSWDIPLAYLELVATAVVAAGCVAMSIRSRPSLVLAPAQLLSVFCATSWLWSVFLFLSWV